MEVTIESTSIKPGSCNTTPLKNVSVAGGLMDIESESGTGEVDIKTEPGTSSAGTSKLGLCEVCGCNDGKYTCPECEIKTCSLKCNRIHKMEFKCAGNRCRSRYIPLNKFTNLDLSNDLKLMEEIARNLEAGRKEFGEFDATPRRYYRLRKAAYERRTLLKLLPHKFERRSHNSSHFIRKSNTIYWHVEWIFVNADNIRLHDDKVAETERISSVLSKHLLKQEDECLQEKLQFYQAVNIPGIKLYLKAERRAGNKFYELDPSLTLRECLEKKIIIEFPTIHVVLKDHGLTYNVIDSDDEDTEVLPGRVKSGNEVVQNILKRAESNESLTTCFRNLLFPDNSDIEMSPDEEQ